MVVRVRDDNGFYYVPLKSWPIKITLNNDQIQLAIMRNASPHHRRTTAKLNGFLDVAGGIGDSWVTPQTSSSISYVQTKAAFIGPMNRSPRCKIRSVAYLTPCQTCWFVFWCHKGTFYKPPGSVPSSLQPNPYDPR